MSYLESIDVQLTEIPKMYLLSIRKNVLEHEFPEEYGTCFRKLFRNMEEKKLTAAAPPMVLFHGDEYTPFGLDTEFAIPVKEYATGTRDFCPLFEVYVTAPAEVSEESQLVTEIYYPVKKRGSKEQNGRQIL